MKNYLIAFLLFGACLFWINCSRPVKEFGRQYVELPIELLELKGEAVVLEDSFYLGDTIKLVYTTNGISLFDTIKASINPAKNLRFLQYEKLGPPKEVMFARMDISEIEQQKRHVFTYIAKGTGPVTVSLQEVSTKEADAVELPEPKSWKIRILKP